MGTENSVPPACTVCAQQAVQEDHAQSNYQLGTSAAAPTARVLPYDQSSYQPGTNSRH
jgi:hypothetical protein